MGEMENPMIERVARAIAQADEQNGGPPYDYRVSLSKHSKEQLFDQARAAIEAMREPTEDMAKAFKHHAMPDGDFSDGYDAMIDAALSPPVVDPHGTGV